VKGRKSLGPGLSRFRIFADVFFHAYMALQGVCAYVGCMYPLPALRTRAHSEGAAPLAPSIEVGIRIGPNRILQLLECPSTASVGS
jgi:hypothetical protein